MSKSTAIVAIIMLAVGLVAGYVLFGGQPDATSNGASTERTPLFYRNPMNPEVTSPVPAKDSMGMDYIPVFADEDKPASAEREVLFYRNPMNPAVTSPVPAQDSMGMDYVPVYADNDSGNDVAGTVKIDPTVVQNIGVRTAKATRQALGRSIKTVGRVAFNEERMARLHPKVEGWIEEIRIDKTGQSVTKNDILLTFYSPKLVSAQQEYLLALNNEQALKDSPFERIRSGAEALTESARERLNLLDVPAHQIRELEQSRKVKKYIHIHAPWTGTIIDIGARAGQFVTPQTQLYMMVDLSEVWAYADVYEYELPWVKPGDAVSMTLASVPGRTFSGSVDYIYPYAESQTRTTKVRMIFDNQDRQLRPDMFADVTIDSDVQQNAVVIPSEAVIRSGDRTQAFVVTGPGTFEPRTVRLGVESNGQVAVLDGIAEGESVVTSAQFLVDSESKLREATAKMMSGAKKEEDEKGPMPTGMDMEHSGHDMEDAGHVMPAKEHQHD